MTDQIQNQTDVDKIYSPQIVEPKWYKFWEENKYFKAKPGKANKSFCIIMPPPNVTGMLHAGHALDCLTQDAIIRFKRMKGFETLYLPGMDHAGIATQSVVEKQVKEKENKTRHDFSREEFVQKIWKWKEESGGIIAKQQRAMGISPDWDYFTFTMDEGPNLAVNKVFVDLFNEGLIYQSDYIVNWDPILQSAISDEEVDHKEVTGAFYHLKYQVKGSEEFLEVATTRPETLLGDTAVAVNPEDPRYKHLIGKMAIVPYCNREVPIIGDEHVDKDFGTGCLKVTPGHDFNDYEIGKRHKLPIVNILNKDGTLNDLGLDYKGQKPEKMRQKFVTLLEEQGILIKKVKHVHQVGHSSKSDAIVEPMVSKQWFVNVKSMAAAALEAVQTDKTMFFPKEWENTYFSWMKEPRDWCISRQLWWGHRIPVYTCSDCGKQEASSQTVTICKRCSSKNVVQDPDVLDTWFSSALWPFSTLGWPNPTVMKEKKFETFFPTTTLVTGFDIIFFWVARMMMMSLKNLGEVPFKHVYIHAIVRDKQGRKMSKSLGNGIDPLEISKEYGTDAFRFTLAAGAGYGRNLNLDPARITGYRNFVNKVWNAFRFISPYLEKAQAKLPESSEWTHHDRWIMAELNTVTKIMNESLELYRFDLASQAIYDFVYEKFCSWYIELSKPIFNSDDNSAIIKRATFLKFAFKKILALLHPITPFFTEEIWSNLKEKDEDLLIVADYPEYSKNFEFERDQKLMNHFIEVTTLIRNLRASVNLPPKDNADVSIFTDDKDFLSYIQSYATFFKTMGKVNNLTLTVKSAKRPGKSIMAASSFCEAYLTLDGLIDLAEYSKLLEKDLAKTEQELVKLNGKLLSENFVKNASPEIIAESREKQEKYSEKVESLKAMIKSFNS
jgi:valyl-tRNA synthetase